MYAHAIFLGTHVPVNSHSLRIFKRDTISLHEFHSLCRFIRYMPTNCNAQIVSLLQHRAIASAAFKASLTNITATLACLH